MSREVWRMRNDFDWPIGEGWWGFLLDPIPCQSPHGGKEDGQTRSGAWCATCEGESTVAVKVDPPGYRIGDWPTWATETWEAKHGWQMWEDVSEGSPISPVCSSPEALAHWLADNDASAMGNDTASYEAWMAMIKEGWAASMVVSPEHGLQSGVDFALTQEAPRDG